MTIQFTVYDTASGQPLRTGSCMTETQANAQAGPGERVMLVKLDPDTQMVQDPSSGTPAPAPRPAMSAIAINKTSFFANGNDQILISNVPSGAIARVEVPPNLGILPVPVQSVTDGVLAITTTVAGTYTITLSLFPNADYKVNVNAA